MTKLNGTRLLLAGRAFNILGVSTLETRGGFTLILHTAGGANPMLMFEHPEDRAIVCAALETKEDK